MKSLPAEFAAYKWAPSTAELARRAGLDPVQIVRFDGNVPARPNPTARPATVAAALAEVNNYAHGGYPDLIGAIAGYAGVAPENVVLGAGADDLILLCARTFAGPGEEVAIVPRETYPLFRTAVGLAGASVGSESPAFTFCCRPNNPTGELGPFPDARPLVVDEAYWEYSRAESAVALIEDGVVVIRTFSKAFGLAGARVGYALADAEIAAELNRRQAPLPVSTLSAALALAALVTPPDVTPEIDERDRLAEEVRKLGLEPLPSWTNFLCVPVDEPEALAESLLTHGVVVRVQPGAIRFSVRDRADDDLLLEALAASLSPSDKLSQGAAREAAGSSVAATPARESASDNLSLGEKGLAPRSARHLRVTAETRMRVRVWLDGAGRVRVATGAGLYDHLLEQLAFHGGLDLDIEGVGDLETGDHHTAEDAALALGEALDKALGDRRGITRYGGGDVPMDDALARASVDLGGRPWAEVQIDPDPGMARHMLASLAQAGRLAIHVEARGQDAHHTAEAAFKAVGRALRAALKPESDAVPSTKGLL